MKLRALVLAGLLFANTTFADAPSGRVLGSAVSAITIDLYHDFQCPGCKVLYEQTLKPLIANYVKTGRVYLVEHYYPLPIHAFAREAACLACAADRIGKYEQVCDILFKKQEDWERTGKVEETVCSVLTASEAAKVRALAKDPSVIAEVDKDIALGQQHRVPGTPTMLITKAGKTYTIATPVSYSMLTRVLDNLK
ncbi:MAG: DsbA family protein [Acidobacteriia bacterium]|nr:DsbA family protein [Terriglobia bacterium]